MLFRYHTMRNVLFFLLGVLFCILLGLLLSANKAHAAGDVAHVAITSLPSQYTDGSPLPVSDIQEIRVTWFRPGSSEAVGLKVLSPTQLAVDIPGMKCGDFQFFAFVLTTPTAKFPNANGDQAGPQLYSTGVSCVPKAPGLTVS